MDKLVPDSTQLKATSTICWTPLAAETQAVLYNGQHRIEANIVRVADILATQNTITSKYHNKDLSKPRFQNIKDKLDALTSSLQAEKIWGVQLYDLGTICIVVDFYYCTNNNNF